MCVEILCVQLLVTEATTKCQQLLATYVAYYIIRVNFTYRPTTSQYN